MKILTLIPALMLTACVSHGHRQTAAPVTTVGHLVSANTLRTSEQLKEYRFGRYVDPGDSMVMHEGHHVYRLETSAGWNLTIFVGPGPTPRVTTAMTTSKRDAVLIELNKERVATRAFAEQTAALNQHLAAMTQAVAKTKDVAEQNAALQREIATVRDRLDSLDGQMREQKPIGTASPQPSPADKW